MRNICLDICYDGTRYSGWQRLVKSENTIQGKLENVLSRILGETIELIGSGRTDAGVHALHQTANFHTNSSLPDGQILNELRRYLPDDIGINSCHEVPERFHARYNAQRKVYCYRLWISEMPCVFERRYVYQISEKLDLQKMRDSAKYLTGEHDFKAFCTKSSSKKSTVRKIERIEFVTDENELKITFEGNGFLYNMVRIIVGTLIEVGTGKRDPNEIPQLFNETRSSAGYLVPAKGLCLMYVVYGKSNE